MCCESHKKQHKAIPSHALHLGSSSSAMADILNPHNLALYNKQSLSDQTYCNCDENYPLTSEYLFPVTCLICCLLSHPKQFMTFCSKAVLVEMTEWGDFWGGIKWKGGGWDFFHIVALDEFHPPVITASLVSCATRGPPPIHMSGWEPAHGLLVEPAAP